MNKLTHRKLLKWVHWLSAGLILYFIFVEPDLPRQGTDFAKTDALSTHAGVGALLGMVIVFWMVLFAINGAAGKPSPRLSGWKRTVYNVLNRGLYFVLPLFMMTGVAAGMTAPFLVSAFGMIPLNVPGVGNDGLHDFVSEIHELAFDILLLTIIAHAVFHVWRHFWLKDNALRVMVPQVLHKYL